MQARRANHGRLRAEDREQTAVRDLSVPIADVTSFDNLIETVIDDNPFGCVGYTGSDGQPVAAVVRNREHYTAKVDFIDGEGKRVGNVSLQSPSITAFNANAAEALANAAFAARCSDWSGAGAP